MDLLPSVEPFRPSDSALREALLHLGCAESRAILPGGQLAALARVRRPPTGFAQLLLAEALSLGLAATDDVAARDPVALGLVGWLLEESGRPPSGELVDLSARNQIHETLVLLQGGRFTDAGDVLMNAAALAMRGTPDPDVYVDLCEAQARWAWNHQDLETAVTCYGQALDFLHRRRPARRFEIHGEIATLHALRGALAEMACAERRARRALRPLRNGADPVLATGAVLRDAELTQQLAMIVPPGHVLRQQGVRRAADALQAAADDFDRFTDPLTRAEKDLCQARLFLSFDRKEAAARYQRAAEGFRSYQADDHYFDVLAEEVTARLMGDLLDDTGVRESWTPQELADLISALARSSTWMDVDVHTKPD